MSGVHVEAGVGLLGATSLVGECLIPLLGKDEWRVVAFSRRSVEQSRDGILETSDVDFITLPLSSEEERLKGDIANWVCLAPIWVLPEYFEMIAAARARRVVVLSSTSRFTKSDSSDPNEHGIAAKLAECEERLRLWAEKNGVEWVILRPTLIYGRGRDKNVSEIARFISRFGFFPLLGRAMGLRQPIHAEDVAAACAAALTSPVAANRAYNLSGGETLPYRDMVGRLFTALNRRSRTLSVPVSLFRGALACLRLLPRYRHWNVAMAERMNRDLVFDHAEAKRDLGFSPRPFHLAPGDLPSQA